MYFAWKETTSDNTQHKTDRKRLGTINNGLTNWVIVFSVEKALAEGEIGQGGAPFL